ncbi:MAG: wax ester/triacylglycerol synthase family O-acyltransferase [Myxococcota bacterium]
MARYAYERLSAQDATFLYAEGPNQPMHVGAVAIFEAEPLCTDTGSIDIDLYRRAIEGVLHWIPRYRQKLAYTPVEGWPIWVDDRRFDLGYHIRHIALPKPGSQAQLKELTARIHARALDRRHPLWEIWVIEGVENGSQVAILNKIHHCMIDGAAGADLSQILMSASPRLEIPEPVPFMPRPEPTTPELLADAVRVGLKRPFSAIAGLAGSEPPVAETPEGPGWGERLQSLGRMLEYALRPASETPLNGDLGPHRRLDWLTMPMSDLADVSRELGCTMNDVVLTTVCGAVRRYLFRRRVDYRNLDFRVAAPVSTREKGHDRRQGNHVSTWIVPLPLQIDEPLQQLAAIQETTRALKKERAALAVDTLMLAAEWLPTPVLERSVALAQGPANMIVTNVPGPQFPLYAVGARMYGMYPLVPLLPGGGLGVALFSYEGKLCWGFNADHELVPDVARFVDDVRVSFEALRSAAVTEFMARRTGTEAPSEPADSEAGTRAKPTRARKRQGSKRKRRTRESPAPAYDDLAASEPAVAH